MIKVLMYLSSLMFTTTFIGVFHRDPGRTCSGSLSENFLEVLGRSLTKITSSFRVYSAASVQVHC